ncbi:uncharacterized protein LOC124911970 [Impatiens glandulifera]|uniref:uncharacterized protein LOC124911970 n=1 Tax=Impatiens glandulifera TaxID=253017 RepID=UPI001FB131AD|nr:uncharacterized protein LOC124911970 [Impatiens glandulifera]
MAACKSIRHIIFDKPLPPPDTPTNLNHPIPWNHNRSFTEIFGDLYFNQNLPSSESSPPSFHSRRYSFSNIYDHEGSETEKSHSESLQHCTEGLGLESSVDDTIIEDLNIRNLDLEESSKAPDHSRRCYRRSLSYGGGDHSHFPPPISCIGRNVSFKCFRSDGRFILKEVRIPNQDFLHVKREHGRLQLRFVQSDDEEETEMEVKS